MVLRKPYAFFIKHFKLFHVILSGLIILSIVRMTGVISFVNSYLASGDTLITMNDVERVFSTIDFVVPIVALCFSILLLVVMTMKKKPNKYYAYSTIITILIFVLNIYGYNTLKALTKDWLYSSRISTLGDLYVFALLGSVIEVAISISRAIGFNVSRFDFNNDILKLELSEKDNEEFEVVVDFDINDLKRNTQKRFRYFKYFLKENKSTIVWSIGIIIAFVALYTGFTLLKYKKNVVSMSKLNSSVINGFKMEINNSYIINTDLNGNEFPDNKTLVVLDMTITNTDTRNEQQFSTGVVNITIGDESYYSTMKYEDSLIDLGRIYTNTKVKASGSERKLFAFEVPENRLSGKILFGVRNLSSKETMYVKLNPINLITNDTKVVENNIGNKLEFTDSTIKDSSIKINSYDIKNVFRIDYNYCTKTNKCLSSVEYLTAKNSNSNYDKVLLKLEGDFNISEDNIINDFYTLLSRFGYIEYEIGDKVYIEDNIYGEVKSSKITENNTYYIEVLSDVQNADSIVLGMKIRNVDYRYSLKGIGE